MTKTKFEAMEILNKDDIPCGPILSMKELAEDQSLRATGTVVEVDHPTRGKYLSVGNPIKLSDSPSEVTRSPLLGEHTDEILRQVLGFSDHQVAEIHDSGALAPPRKVAPTVLAFANHQVAQTRDTGALDPPRKVAPAYGRFEH
jgi:formyl-CoA transferase